MNTNTKIDIITTPNEVIAMAGNMGYNLHSMLELCGVKLNTFQSWKQKKEVGNESAAVLFNLIHQHPEIYSVLRELRT